MHFKKALYNLDNTQYVGQPEPKLTQNATIKILYDFHDFSSLPYLDNVYRYLEHAYWHLDNPGVNSSQLATRSSKFWLGGMGGAAE